MPFAECGQIGLSEARLKTSDEDSKSVGRPGQVKSLANVVDVIVMQAAFGLRCSGKPVVNLTVPSKGRGVFVTLLVDPHDYTDS